MKTYLLTLLLTGISLAEPLNDLILNSIRKMPIGGGYSVQSEAAIGLRRSNDARNGNLLIAPRLAQPSYCSGATYLVFLNAIQSLQEKQRINLSHENLVDLLVKGESDGQGVWGRWNANGPGTAKLFHDLQLGTSFEDIHQAKPGDFMKIFWSKEIGGSERGHLVIYLGKKRNDQGEWEIEYWSSNKPKGYSIKRTQAHYMRWCIFSRLEYESNLKGVSRLSDKDQFLADMLKKDFTRDQVRKTCNITGAEFNEANLQQYLSK